MAKILICGLGGGRKHNGEYQKADYSIGKKGEKDYREYHNCNFISSALEEHHGIDKTIYIGTTGSMWDSLFQYYSNKKNIPLDEDYFYYLAEKIENAHQETPLDWIDFTKFNELFGDVAEIKITKYGIDSHEIFQNFNIIMELEEILESGDEVYIDITHSFRSNALWMYLVMNYITDVSYKDIKIGGISYGMFEIKDRTTNLSPIIDLTAFYDLTKWIKGANDLKNYGNSYQLLELINNKDVENKFKTFSVAMSFNYVGAIKQNLQSIKKITDKLGSLEGPASLIIPKIALDFINEFDNVPEDYLLLGKLAKWHFKFKRYALSYININESIVTYVTINLLGSDTEENRGKAKIFLRSIGHRKDSPQLKTDKDGQKLRKLYLAYEHSRTVRNDIAHSLGIKDSAINDVESLKNYCSEIEEMLGDKNLVDRAIQKFNFLDREY